MQTTIGKDDSLTFATDLFPSYAYTFESVQERMEALLKPVPVSEIDEIPYSKIKYVPYEKLICLFIERTGGMFSTDVVSEWCEIRPLRVKVYENPNDKKNSKWEFQIIETPVRFAKVRITVPGLGARTAIGLQAMFEGSGEDLEKGAVTDALKKAIEQFGLAAQVTRDYETGMRELNDRRKAADEAKRKQQQAERQAKAQSPQPAPKPAQNATERVTAPRVTAADREKQSKPWVKSPEEVAEALEGVRNGKVQSQDQATEALATRAQLQAITRYAALCDIGENSALEISALKQGVDDAESMTHQQAAEEIVRWEMLQKFVRAGGKIQPEHEMMSIDQLRERILKLND